MDWLAKRDLGWRDVRWYTDRGVSSALTSRPAFDRMMQAAIAGETSQIVVYKMDRIGRWDSDDFLAWRIAVKRAGVELTSLTEQTAFESLADKIIALVTAEADKLWLDGHRRRVTAGITAKRRAGEAWGGARKVGAGVGFAKLTPDQWQTLADQAHKGASYAALAREHNLNHSYVARKLAQINTQRGAQP